MVLEAFADVVGQPLAVDLLQRSLAQRRLAPAYLFAGPEGVGRRLVAKHFAQQIVGLDRPTQPTLGRRIAQCNHPDVLWVEPTYLHQGRPVTPAEAVELGIKRKTAPQVRLSQVRQIGRYLSRPPLEASRSVVVIEGAETMAEAAANGLLKTLEEPGAAVLILIAPGSHQLLPTLVSRCQLIPFLRLSPEAMATVLRRLERSDVLQQREILALAQGSPGQALAADRQRQQIPPELLAALEQSPASLHQALERGRQVAQTLDLEAQLWLVDYLQQRAWQPPQLAQTPWLQALEQAKKQLRSYCQPRLVWEVAFMGWLPAPSGSAGP